VKWTALKGAMKGGGMMKEPTRKSVGDKYGKFTRWYVEALMSNGEWLALGHHGWVTKAEAHEFIQSMKVTNPDSKFRVSLYGRVSTILEKAGAAQKTPQPELELPPECEWKEGTVEYRLLFSSEDKEQRTPYIEQAQTSGIIRVGVLASPRIVCAVGMAAWRAEVERLRYKWHKVYEDMDGTEEQLQEIAESEEYAESQLAAWTAAWRSGR
jgi:hypothetical protein